MDENSNKEVVKVEETKTTPIGEHAGFGIRLIASIVDGVIVGFAARLLNELMGGSFYTADFGSIPSLLVIAYYIIMDVMYGATLGKMAFKLKVVHAETGEKLNWGQAIMREFIGKFVSAILLGFGYLMVLWDKDKQGLHDKIASSYVIKE